MGNKKSKMTTEEFIARVQDSRAQFCFKYICIMKREHSCGWTGSYWLNMKDVRRNWLADNWTYGKVPKTSAYPNCYFSVASAWVVPDK